MTPKRRAAINLSWFFKYVRALHFGVIKLYTSHFNKSLIRQRGKYARGNFESGYIFLNFYQ